MQRRRRWNMRLECGMIDRSGAFGNTPPPLSPSPPRCCLCQSSRTILVPSKPRFAVMLCVKGVFLACHA
jgi:hypothetical protein